MMGKSDLKNREQTSVMICLQQCPRCGGAVLEYPSPAWDDPLCINCGWRRAELGPDIRAEVQDALGKPYLADLYTAKRIGTGKPPLSGWERFQLRRQRDRSRKDEGGHPL